MEILRLMLMLHRKILTITCMAEDIVNFAQILHRHDSAN